MAQIILEDQTLWQERLHSLWSLATLLQKRFILSNSEIASNLNKGDPNESIIDFMLEELQSFGDYVFWLLEDGFGDQIILEIKETDSDDLHPPITRAFALRRVHDQIASDLAVLHTALEQRIISKFNGQEMVKNAFYKADRLAAHTRESLAHYLDPSTQTLTYFHKYPNVQVVPYAPAAIIGIPSAILSATNNTRDWLAIPHEFAHHLYWFGEVPLPTGNDGTQGPGAYWQSRKVDPGAIGNGERRLHRRLHEKLNKHFSEGIPRWVLNWREEIFADVVGCMVGGPAAALAFQEMQIEHLDLFEDNQTHPIPAMRPFIYSYTLDKLGNPAGSKLHDSWAQRFSGTWDIHHLEEHNFVLGYMGEDREPVTLTLEELLNVVDIVHQVLGIDDTNADVASIPRFTPDRMWSTDLCDFTPERVGEIVVQGDNNISSFKFPQEASESSASKPSLLVTVANSALGETNVLKDLVKFLPDEIGVGSIEPASTSRIVLNQLGLRQLLSFGGWTTAGPGGAKFVP